MSVTSITSVLKLRPRYQKSRPQIEIVSKVNLDLQQGGLDFWQGGLDLQQAGKYFQKVRTMFVYLVALNVQNWLGLAFISHYLSMVTLPK